MTESRPDGLLEVGRFGRPHGLAGEIYVSLSTDRDERLAKGSRLWAGRWLNVAWSKRTADRWVVSLVDHDDRTSVESLVNRTIWAEPIDDPQAVWVHQVIGAEVREIDGRDRGRCVAVVANPADDLLELDTGALVPARFVTGVVEEGDRFVVLVDAPSGLFDLGVEE
jgi:16S rRNA processing protein RimM